MKLFRLAVVAMLGTLLAACQSSMSQSSQSSASMPMPSSSSSPSSSAPIMPAPSSSSTAQSSSRPSIPPSGSAGQQSQQSSRSGSQSSAPAASSQSSRASARNSQSGGNLPAASIPGAGSQDEDAKNGRNEGSSGEIVGANSGPDSSNGAIASSGSGEQIRESTAQGPGQTAGTSARMPAEGASDGGEARDTSTGAANSGTSGNQGSSNAAFRRPSGDYGLDSLPSGASVESVGQIGTGSMTAAERAAVLDERLRRGYETFDGFILGERERAQNESNAAGSVIVGGASAGTSVQQPQFMESDSNGSTDREMEAVVSTRRPDREEFSAPEDIAKNGRRGEDRIATQIYNAASVESDPVLREALWEEYRGYMGIGDGQ